MFQRASGARSVNYDLGVQRPTYAVKERERDGGTERGKETVEGGSSRRGVRLSHSVTGSMLTQTSFGLLTIYIWMCVCVRASAANMTS